MKAITLKFDNSFNFRHNAFDIRYYQMKKGYAIQFIIKSSMSHLVWTDYRLSCHKASGLGFKGVETI